MHRSLDKSPRTVRFFGKAAFLLAVAVPHFSPLHAEETENVVLVDGISVITGSQTSNESDAISVLLSDVEFDATLILTTKHGATGALRDPTESEWRRAKRHAVLIHLLAAKARYLHETASDEDRQAIQDEITAMVGGESAMSTILARLGLGFQDLSLFSETAALALTQIRYFEEQVESSPSSRRGRRHSRRPGPDKRASAPNTTTAKGTFLRMKNLIETDGAQSQLQNWIAELIENGHIRMVR
jgi:hypothetical protein